jgi:hypothetical protein
LIDGSVFLRFCTLGRIPASFTLTLIWRFLLLWVAHKISALYGSYYFNSVL